MYLVKESQSHRNNRNATRLLLVILKLTDTEELDDEQVRKFLQISGLFLESFFRLGSDFWFWRMRGLFQSHVGRRVVLSEFSSENLTVSARSDCSRDFDNALHDIEGFFQ